MPPPDKVKGPYGTVNILGTVAGSCYLEDLEDSLNKAECSSPDCTENHTMDESVYLHSSCHIEAGVEVCFRFGDEFISVLCAECGDEVVKLRMASKGRTEQ